METIFPKEVGIAVAIPNTIKQKLDAILELSKAVKTLAEALISVNVQVDIKNCTLNNCGTGIKVDLKEPETNY